MVFSVPFNPVAALIVLGTNGGTYVISTRERRHFAFLNLPQRFSPDVRKIARFAKTLNIFLTFFLWLSGCPVLFRRRYCGNH